MVKFVKATDFMKCLWYPLTQNKELLSLKTSRERIKFVLERVHALGSLRKEVHEMADKYLAEHRKSVSKSVDFKQMGINCHENKDYGKAKKMFTKAILSAPVPEEKGAISHIAQAYAHKSLVEFVLKDYWSALTSANQSLKLFETIEMHLQRVHCLRLLRRYSESLEFVDQLIERFNNNDGLDLKEVTDEELITLKRYIIRHITDCEDSFGKTSQKQKVNPLESSTEELEEYEDNVWVHPNCQIKSTERKGRHVMSKEFIPKGTVIVLEHPFTTSMVSEMRTKICSNCYKMIETSIWPCVGCDEVVFCDQNCFVKAYDSHHKYECGISGLINSLGHCFEHTYQVVAKTGIQKLIDCEQQNHCFDFEDYLESKRKPTENDDCGAGGGCTNFEENFDTELKAYSSLLNHDNIQDINTYAFQCWGSIIVALLLDYCQRLDFNIEEDFDKFVTVVELCIKNVRRVLTNVFGWISLPTGRLGSCMCTVSSLLNHSCLPNVWWSYVGPKMVFKTVRDVNPGEELCITYGPRVQTTTFLERQKKLKSCYFFNCNCQPCLSDCKNMLTIRCDHCSGPVVYTVLDPLKPRDNRCLECGQKFENLKQSVQKVIALKTRFEQMMSELELNQRIESSLNVAKNVFKGLMESVYLKSKDLKLYFKQLIRTNAKYKRFDEAVQCIEEFGPTICLEIYSNEDTDSLSADILEDLLLLTNCYYMHLNESQVSDTNKWNNCFLLYSKLIVLLKKGKKASADTQPIEGLFSQIRGAIKEKKNELLELKNYYESIAIQF